MSIRPATSEEHSDRLRTRYAQDQMSVHWGT